MPALCLTFNLTGAAAVTGSNWVYAAVPDVHLPDSTCAEYGASTLKSEEPGLPKVVKVIGGQSVEAEFGADAPPAATGAKDAAATGSVSVDDVSYESGDGGAKIDLNPDGSGKLTFAKLTSTTGNLAGTITWSCVDPA